MTVAAAVRVGASTLPLEAKVAGMPLVLRAVLSLKRAGLSPVRVLVSDAERPRVRAILQTRELDDVELVQAMPDDEPAVVLPHDVVCDPSVIRALCDAPSRALATRGGEPLGPERTGGGGAGAPVLLEVGDAFVEHVEGPASAARATRALFEACRKPVDGVVSRYLNRHISLFVSKRLVGTQITPNQITLANFGVGLLAAAAASQGGYAWTLLGALLLQANSIFDGVDGELARVRHQHSRLGQWLDTLTDDLVNVVFWAALGVGAAGLPQGQLLMQLGFLAAASHLLFAAIYWVELLAIGSGDTYDIDWWFRRAPPRGPWGRVLAALLYVPKKDFFIFFCFACAVFGVLSYTLPLMAFAVLCSTAGALSRGVLRLARWGRQRAVGRAAFAEPELGAWKSQKAGR